MKAAKGVMRKARSSRKSFPRQNPANFPQTERRVTRLEMIRPGKILRRQIHPPKRWTRKFPQMPRRPRGQPVFQWSHLCRRRNRQIWNLRRKVKHQRRSQPVRQRQGRRVCRDAICQQSRLRLQPQHQRPHRQRRHSQAQFRLRSQQQRRSLRCGS